MIKEFKVDTLPATNIQLDQTPGLSVDKLDANISIRGIESSTGGGQVKVLPFSKLAVDGNGTVDYTGFGFTPTSYVIQAWGLSGVQSKGMSYSSYIGSSINGFHMQEISGSINIFNLASRVIAVYDSVADNTRANHSSFLTDGLRLDFVTSGLDIEFIITAYA